MSKSKAEQPVQGHRGGKGNEGSNVARLVLLRLLSHQRLQNSQEPCCAVHLTECGGDVGYIFNECLAGYSQLRARLLFVFIPPPITIWKLFLKVLDFCDQVFLGTRMSSDILSRL